jgi:hypothetical protein
VTITIVLALASFVCFAGLSWATYRCGRHLSTLLLTALVYLYTYHGFAVSLLISAGVLQPDPMFLGGAPYDVAINADFWTALLLQSLFANAYMLVLAAFLVRKPQPSPVSAVRQYSPEPLIAVSLVALALGGAMWLQALRSALASQQSLYLFFKEGGDLGVWYPVSRVLFDLASTSAGASLGLLFAQRGSGSGRRRLFLALLAGVCGSMVAVTMSLLGDRATLLGGFTFGLLIAGQRGLRITRLLPVGVIALGLLNVVAILREGGSVFQSEGPSLLSRTLGGLLVTHEATITFSTYATLRFHVPSSHGESVAFMLQALIPRFIRAQRTAQDAFAYYAYEVGLPPLRGWGMHYATDAFINFGVIGVVAAAVVLAVLHGYLLKKSESNPAWLFPFAGCLASFPIAFRAGIPGLKTVIIGLMSGYMLGWLAEGGLGRTLESIGKGHANRFQTNPRAVSEHAS